eukprot:4658964-Pyramimonas_sp.AAC.2
MVRTPAVILPFSWVDQPFGEQVRMCGGNNIGSGPYTFIRRTRGRDEKGEAAATAPIRPRTTHQSQKGQENIPVAGTNHRRGERI